MLPRASFGGGSVVGADGHQQRKKPSVVASRIDVQIKLDGMDLGSLLVGSQNARLRAGNGDCAGQVGIVGVQHIETAAVAAGPATHSTPGTPSLRSGHIQRNSGVKRRVNSVGCRQSNSNSTTGPVPCAARHWAKT